MAHGARVGLEAHDGAVGDLDAQRRGARLEELRRELLELGRLLYVCVFWVCELCRLCEGERARVCEYESSEISAV